MLKARLIHPEILNALGRIGHGARVLIADGNYSFATNSPPSARLVFLNLMPGMVKATDVLAALVPSVPIESAMVMMPPGDEYQPIHEEFRKLLPPGIEWNAKTRFDFYDEARSPQTALIIATGESRRFANLLLTIGVIREGE
jgi:L-fucose mutarotase